MLFVFYNKFILIILNDINKVFLIRLKNLNILIFYIKKKTNTSLLRGVDVNTKKEQF